MSGALPGLRAVERRSEWSHPVPRVQSEESSIHFHYHSVEGLFGVVERAIDEEYHKLSIEYNDRCGDPERIDLEIHENATDDQVTYDVPEFQAGPDLHK